MGTWPRSQERRFIREGMTLTPGMALESPAACER